MTQLLGSIFILWAGLILGVSFLATPVKFMVPSLTMPVALELGKVTFHAFNKVEWVVCIMCLTLMFFGKIKVIHWLLISSLLIILLIKSFYLLPCLDLKVDTIVSGGTSNPSSMLHWFYILADILELILTLSAAWFLIDSR